MSADDQMRTGSGDPTATPALTAEGQGAAGQAAAGQAAAGQAAAGQAAAGEAAAGEVLEGRVSHDGAVGDQRDVGSEALFFDQDAPETPGSPEPDDAPRSSRAARAARRSGPSRPRGTHRIERRWLRRVLAAVAVLVVVFLAGLAWYELQAHPGGSPGARVVITVKEGEGASTMVDQMADRGVVTSGLAFRLYLLLHGTPSLTPGNYLLHRNVSFGTARQAMARGPDVWQVEVPAGFTMTELADRVGYLPGSSSRAFLAATKSGKVTSPWQAAGSTNLEGLVAPGRYLVYPGESDVTLLRQMVQRFDQQAAAVGDTPALAAMLGVTPNELVTVASIVEKEGVLPSNMGRVSRVIYNRLAADMPLQMNSTVLYSLGQDGGTVTPADLQLNTPYNTYLHTGLPPTPIAFPSKQAMYYAGHPTPGSWLYFVVVDQAGDEAFSTTYQGQLANEALAQRRGVG